MKPRLPSRGGGPGTRGHLRLLSGAVVTPNSQSARDSSPTGQEASAQPAHTPEPEWVEGRNDALVDDGSGEADDSASKPALEVEHVPVSVRLAALTLLPDAQLVSLALGGEARAFEILYRRHVAFAIHLATRIEGSARDVEDIVHDAFIKAFSRLRDLSDAAAFRSWLGSIVVFAVRSRLRRTRLMNLLGLGRGADPVDLDSIASSDASPHTRAQLAQIYALLRMRPADDRIAWTLRCVEGHELEVVARLTNCSLATVKRRISRIQGFLDEHFVTDAPEAPSRRQSEASGSSGATTLATPTTTPITSTRSPIPEPATVSPPAARPTSHRKSRP